VQRAAFAGMSRTGTHYDFARRCDDRSLFFRDHDSRHLLDRADRFLPNRHNTREHREPPRPAEVPPWGMLLEAR